MSRPMPPDQMERVRALEPSRSVLVQAPAGSGKTDLLTRRFLRLLSEVEEPGQVVAITFTNAAAAEMRHRILLELEKASANSIEAEDAFSMEALAQRALERSRVLGWKLLDLPAQLRISTIDSFCRDLALQQPLLSGFGGGLEIAEQPRELYRRAARRTLRKIDQTGEPLSAAIEALLLWRDNGWQEMEELLVEMLGVRDRWMHEFVLDREPDWSALRSRLERPFANAVGAALERLNGLFGQVPPAREELMKLARFACEQSGGELHRELAELGEFPTAPFADSEATEEARQAFVNLTALLLIGTGEFRRQVTVRNGFPADRKREKARLMDLIEALRAVSGLETALAAARTLPPARYTEDDWRIVRAAFTMLRHAAGELKIVFAEAGSVDFIEVAQVAQAVLVGADGLPTDAALAVSDGIRHLLVDEFQDTSRRQHQLLARLIAAWPEREGRSCFAVGDPMQSIYFFRDADAELFERVKRVGLEIVLPEFVALEPLRFDFVPLRANFRTAPPLVNRLNELLGAVFAANDGSGVRFSAAEAQRQDETNPNPRFGLHLEFAPRTPLEFVADADAVDEKEAARIRQIEQIVALIREQQPRIAQAHAKGERFRVAVLGRARKALVAVAEALRAAEIPFRAVELEGLATRPEVLDALALARALLNHEDRVSWLGVLRAPWCGLALEDLHQLTSGDNPALLARPVPQLLAERLHLLSDAGRVSAERLLKTVNSLPRQRAALPTASLGTLLESSWLRLGGAACVDAAGRANLDLLWSCLDRLPEGEQDLLGPALDAALEKLTALPDPAASSETGVQLMTIHKSKGLEFEVVIVPEMQASGGRSRGKMLSWLERGLAQPDESGEITEFLIAPLQPKGADRGKAKQWVDQVRNQRESQETRRILYVAATRAREELHFFARPAYQIAADGTLSLVEPLSSLLATAWPALEAEVRARFEQWKDTQTQSQPAEEQIIKSLAAAADSNLLVMPAPLKPTLLRRLPMEFDIEQDAVDRQSISTSQSAGFAANEFTRHEGGMLSRALGTAVHALMEELARLRLSMDWEAVRAALAEMEPRITAQARSGGIDRPLAARIAAQALEEALSATHDPVGQWILSPRAEAASEASWAGIAAGSLRTVRVDRVFRAGASPLVEGDEHWWIVDYKTAHAENPDPTTALPELRKLFAPQLEHYAELLRNLKTDHAPVRAGLYYPRMRQFDWWEL